MYIQACQDATSAAENCRVPVIAAIHGACHGVGLDLASACDIRLCSKEAKMSLHGLDLDSAIDFGTTQRFGKKVGNQSWFRELCFTSREFCSGEGHKNGFITSVYEDNQELLKASYELAHTIAAKSPVAVHGSKTAMNFSLDHPIVDGLNHIRMMNSAFLQSEDTSVAAFAALSKKVPSFSKL